MSRLASGGGAQYFARYAEPEARLAASIPDSYAACLVVPVCGEAPDFLEGYRAALERSPGRVLVVVVVNATESASAERHQQNARLLEQLSRQFVDQRPIEAAVSGPRAMLARGAHFDLLWVDRARPGLYLPEGEGVGTARKIGGDLAAALFARGRIACPRIASSDADVTLPDDFFATLSGEIVERTQSAAWLWPFRHEDSGEPRIDEATVLYEISLRYYVLGLSAARSSYAYQSVGSTLSVDARAYVSVRGFPRRAAAEDFYLLDKLAKVLPLRRIAAEPLRIRSRASDRVPFGTGRRSREIAEARAIGTEFLLYAPETFRALGAVIAGLDAFSVTADPSALSEALASGAPELADAAESVLIRLGAFAALERARTQAPGGSVLRRRAHTWFDALRTLRFIHGMRDACLPSRPWRAALEGAPFLPKFVSDIDDPSAVCCRLAELEAALPSQIGPALL